MGVEYNSKIVTDDLVFCIDAGNAKSYPGSGNTWKDLCTSDINGTLSGGPVFNTDVLQFDGSNDHVDFPSSSNFTFGTGDFTISWWLNYDVVGSNDSSIDMRGSSWETTAFSDYITASDKWATWRKSTSYPSAADTWYTSSTTIVSNKWYNFVALRDSGTFKFYINNVLDGTVSFSENLSGGDLVVGWNVSDNAGRSFDGKFAWLGIYKGRALSTTEITQNFNALKGRFGL